MNTPNVVGSIAPTTEKLSDDDFVMLKEGQQKMAALDVEKATINNFVLGILLKKYKLQQGDNLDVDTGVITRKVETKNEAAKPETEVATETSK